MHIRLLEVEFDALTIPELHALIADAVFRRKRRIIAHHNLHSIYLFHTESRMRDFFCIADKIQIDGMSLIFLARLFGYRVHREHRVTYLDWISPLMTECSQRGWRVFYLGGKPGIAAKAAQRLQQSHPSLTLETRHGYFSKTGQENSQVLSHIRDFQPHLLLVGMGMPLQEHWILENLEQIQANVILTTGACFDYIAEAIPSPPRWLGRLGFEWLFRLMSEPERLWQRYLVEPWYILGLVLKQLFQRDS